MKRHSRLAARRMILLVAVVLGMAVVCSGGVGADPSLSQSGPGVAVSGQEPVGIGDAVCLQRGPSGPEPCLPLTTGKSRG